MEHAQLMRGKNPTEYAWETKNEYALETNTNMRGKPN
jgi:hypothetical protein